MPKLIYISNSKLPTTWAHGLQIMQMCAAFSQCGYDVELMVPKRIGGIAEDPFSYYGIEKSFTVSKVPCIDLIFLQGNKIFFLLQLFSFLFVCRLKLLFRKADILYSREQTAGLLFKNISLELHSLPKNKNQFYLHILKRAKALVVLTPFIKERLVSLGIRASTIVVAPDAVNLEKFNIAISQDEARERLGLPRGKKLIGYVGMLRTLGMEKGIDITIRAFADLKERQDIMLVLVGGHQEDIDFYKNVAQKAEIADRVLFVSMVRHEVIPMYLKSFDLLMAPFPESEHYNFYMSPLKVFEYMASKKPIISTNLPSLKFFLNDTNALLTNPGDVRELREAMVKGLDDADFAHKIAEQAFRDAKEHTWTKRAERIIAFIEGKNKQREIESGNIASFSSDLSVKEYSKKYLRAGEEWVIGQYMSSGKRVLDIGCGAGRTTSYIADNGAEVIGADIALPLVVEAKKKYPSLDFRVMDARHLDFPDATFDTVFFSFNGIDNLASLEEREKALLEMRRVLKPDGFLIYSSHNSLALPRKINSWKIILANFMHLRVGAHWRVEKYNFGTVIQYYNNVWSECAHLQKLHFKNEQVVGNSQKLLHAPRFVLAFLDKFPLYIAQK